MDYLIEYYKEKEKDPIEFLNHLRRTTESIGGGTISDDNGELVDYDAAVVAVDIARQQMIEKAVEWLKGQKEMVGISFEEDFLERYKQAMKEE